PLERGWGCVLPGAVCDFFPLAYFLVIKHMVPLCTRLTDIDFIGGDAMLYGYRIFTPNTQPSQFPTSLDKCVLLMIRSRVLLLARRASFV
ncbi:MAG: hypothetical protein ACPGWR_13260, partial [Ardenticatenaceae bacterium]